MTRHRLLIPAPVSAGQKIPITRAMATQRSNERLQFDSRQLAACAIGQLPQLRRIDSLPGPQETVLAVAFSPNGKHLACGSYDARIYLWEVDGRHN